MTTEPDPTSSMSQMGHLQSLAGAMPMSALTSKADIGLRSMRPDVAVFVAATSNPFHSVTNHSKVDPADQIRTKRLGGAHCGHRLSQSADVRSKRHDSA
jgi:hypothetical protein